jgi:hypothetical protein
MDRLFGYRIEDVLAQRLHLGLLLVLAVLAVAALRGSTPEDIGVFLGVVLVRIAEGFADVSAGQLQRVHRPKQIAFLYNVRCVLGLGAFAALLAAGLPLALALAGMGTANLLAFFLADRPLLAAVGAMPDLRAAVMSIGSARPFWLGMKLLPGALLAATAVFEVNLPRYVVEAFRGVTAVGVYTTLGMLLSAATNIVHPVFFMTFASLGQIAQRHDAESSKRLLKMIGTNIALTIAFSFLIIAVSGGFSSWILITVFGPGWASFHALFSVLAVGAGVSLVRSCLGFILTGLNAFSSQTAITVLSGVLFVALAVLLGGREDAVGIALAWTCASSVAVCANTVILCTVLRRYRLAPQVSSMTAAAHLGGER